MFWSEEFYPPKSPYLNPLDYAEWLKRSLTSTDVSLRTAIQATFVDMDRDSLKRTSERLKPRKQPVIQAEVG